MLDAERAHAVAVDAAEPGERRRMAVDHGDEAAVARQRREQPLDMAHGAAHAVGAGARRRRPAGIEPVGRGDREQADVAAVLADQAGRLDRLGRDRAGIGDDQLGVRPRLAQPVAAVDDVGCASSAVIGARRLLERARRQPQIDRAAGFVAQPFARARARRRRAACSRTPSA